MSIVDIPTIALIRLVYIELSTEIGAAVREVAPDQRPVHGVVMEQLDFTDGMRLTELAQGAGMTPQSTGELVDQLEALGYVERRPDPEDRRAKHIYRTDKAKQASKVAIAAAQRSDREMEDLLGDDRYAQLRESLETIVRARGVPPEAPIDLR